MIIDYYNIFNKTEFESLDLVSRTYSIELEGVGLRDILVTKGNLLSITYDGVMLPIGLTEDPVFVFEGYAVYLNPISQDVYLGIVVDEN